MPRSGKKKVYISLLIINTSEMIFDYLPYSDRAMNILFVRVSVADFEAVVDLAARTVAFRLENSFSVT